uniref:FBD domain-containing protein n=1 Tax=Brassica campestris TaxID=3711 RepID=M4FCR7_BRACM
MTKVRDGLLLGKKTILKSDYLPACQNKSVNPRIESAPNYHEARSLHVHGVAMPTAVGIRNLLDHIGAHKASNQVQVLWISLREEPVIYINGKPFVLRDLDNPFTNMGMKMLNVDQMEEDLRGDASRHGNKILVTDELPDGEMVDQWEPVSNESLKTMLEVYQELQAEGYLVEYARVPVTEPKDTDFDALIRKISQADINTEIIFSCQMGRGNTTAGMEIQLSSISNVLEHQEDKIRRGEYAVIRSLIRVLEGGVKGKRQVDNAIDRCASIQNLREAIPTYSSSILRQPDEKKREAAVSLFVEYLERYYFLICFSVYLDSEGAFLQTGSLDHVSFADWMQARPELYGILRRFLRRDPMGALAAMKPSLTKVEESTDGRPHEMSEVAALRSGVVLGSQTVLKSDHSPGCRNASLRERVDGAPNFREVPGFAVYGVANPTIDGIRSVIERGTDRDTVEGVEALLKEDILREAKRYDGAIMVIHETEDQNVFNCWEHVDAFSVQTPLEVFKNLETEGFPVKYARVPVTDGKAPRSSDFDTLTWNIASASKDTAFVFNCQIGRGRTTTGTVIACLVKLRMNYGRPIKVLTDSIVYGDSLSGEEEHGRAFGMDDILLLRKFTTLFDNGVESREALDAVIDRCSAVQNIREAVLHYRKVFNQQHVEPRLRNAALKRSAEYLERYFWLITFAAYIGSKNLDVAFVKGGYKNWLHEKPEVQALKWSVRVRPGRFFTIPEELQSRQGDAVMESIINKRSGSVLCKGSILKKCQRTSSCLQIDEEGEGSTETIREEAHVYINGIPFVLRELHKPVDILTHVGIAGVVVETRLKEDILSEVRETGGRMLLHHEEYSMASNQSQVIGYWEYIQPEGVKTSAEIYAAQERDALPSNVDAIHSCKDEWCGERLFTSSGAIHKQDFGQAYSRQRGGLHYGQDDVCRCLSSYSCLVTSALEVVEVSLHDSTSRAEWDQLEHFLGKLPCLQLLKVRCGGKISREEKLRMARELCQLPKASSKCKIVCT